MVSFSPLALFSSFIAVVAILLVFSIFKKVFQEKYRRPWLFIGISTIILGLNQLLRFFADFFVIYIGDENITEGISYILDFIAILILTYGLLLELMILKYYKGKFVKMKFIPVQEGTLGGEIDLNVSTGNAYLAFKKDRKYFFTQFTQATKKGFEGFLITEDNPHLIRTENDLKKTPIAWVSNIEADQNSQYIKDSLDENSDIINPIKLNNLINYIDNFLEQSQNPFVMIELNLIFKVNNFSITIEFLKYISQRIKKYNGILILMLNVDAISQDQLGELKQITIELE